MPSKKPRRTARIKPCQVSLVRRRWREERNCYGFKTYLELAEAEQVKTSESTVKRFFAAQEPIDADVAVGICRALRLEPEQILEGMGLEAISSSETLGSSAIPVLHPHMNLQGLCEQLLTQPFDLTTNLLLGGQETSLNLDAIYVPTSLVEEPQETRSKAFSSTQSTYNENQPIPQDQFFLQILKQGKSPKSRGRRIALVGEAGAGKTTLLQKIADWIIEQNLGFPIRVRLGQLGACSFSLSQYLTDVWLKLAPTYTDEILEELKRECLSGRVWLLLDGLDEMSQRERINLITSMEEGWVQDARVILTSRPHVWQIAQKILTKFDVYRNSSFTQEQVEQVISRWFNFLGKPESARQLLLKLKNLRFQSLQNLIKNPLCCSLLCRSWLMREGELPSTKFELYSEYIDALYERLEWKPQQLPTPIPTRQELKQSLGQVAKRAFEEEKSRFVFKQDLITEELGEPNQPRFELAFALGLIVALGSDPENPLQKIYAFLHPSFAEYFAASVISDWNLFNNIPNLTLANYDIYRIANQHWKAVILFWLGRPDVDEESKEAFIKSLMDYLDRWPKERLRGKPAYLLAAAGIAEFSQCSRSDELVERVIKWGFGYFDENKQKWQREDSDDLPVQLARAALKETQRNRAIAALVKLIQTAEKDEYICSAAARTLVEIDPGNSIAIDTLLQVIRTTRSKRLREDAAMSLAQMGQGNPNPKAIHTLTKLLEYKKIKNAHTLKVTAECLGRIDPGNSMALRVLEQLTQAPNNNLTRMEAAVSLGTIDPGNSTAIATLIQLIQLPEGDIDYYFQVIESLERIAWGNSTAIASLVELIKNTDVNQPNYEYFVKCLGHIAPGNPAIINVLEQLIEKTSKTQQGRICWQAKASLVKIKPHHPAVVPILRQVIETTGYIDIRLEIAGTLRRIDPDNPDFIGAFRQLVGTSEDEEALWSAAKRLGPLVGDIFSERFLFIYSRKAT